MSPCPSCGGGGAYMHCCPEHGRVVRQPCKRCRSSIVTLDPDCSCYRGEYRSYLSLDTWVTADHHWEHPRIREYQHRPADHFEIMRERWIATVDPEDFILHLGDLVCFGDPTQHPKWVRGLPGRKYLLRGNHDKHTHQWYGAAGFVVLGRKPFNWHMPDGRIVRFSHEPDVESDHWTWNVHGHVHANSLYPGTPRIEDRRNVCVEVTDYAPVRLGAVLGLDEVDAWELAGLGVGPDERVDQPARER